MKIEDAIDSHICLNRANARGDVWYALGKVTACAAELYTLLAALRGFHAYVYRYTEQVLSPEEQALLAQAWPAELSKQEVKRTARALWAWTRYVWQEAERRLGRSLMIQVDEAALLSAVDRLYTSCASLNGSPCSDLRCNSSSYSYVEAERLKIAHVRRSKQHCAK